MRQTHNCFTLSPQFLAASVLTVMDRGVWRGKKIGLFTVLFEVAEV